MYSIYFVQIIKYHIFYNEEKKDEDGQRQIRIELSEHVSFLNKASLQLTLEHLPEKSEVIIDGSLSKEIDYDALELIYNFKMTAPDRDIKCVIVNLPHISSNGIKRMSNTKVTYKAKKGPISA